MFIRELDGFYAGQIREFPADIGAALLAAGRAENPYEPAPLPAAAKAAPPRKAGRG